MVTGMLAVRNLLHGERHDLWSVNTDQDYHEEVQNPGMMHAIGDTLGTAFARLDRVAFGVAVGAGLGVALCVVTVTLAAAGTTPLGAFLMLLSQYFPGYRVSAWGAVLGLVYGFGAGFTLGWIAAALRNTLLFVSLRRGLRRTRGPRLRRLLDYI